MMYLGEKSSGADKLTLLLSHLKILSELAQQKGHGEI